MLYGLAARAGIMAFRSWLLIGGIALLGTGLLYLTHTLKSAGATEQRYKYQKAEIKSDREFSEKQGKVNLEKGRLEGQYEADIKLIENRYGEITIPPEGLPQCPYNCSLQ